LPVCLTGHSFKMALWSQQTFKSWPEKQMSHQFCYNEGVGSQQPAGGWRQSEPRQEEWSQSRRPGHFPFIWSPQ
jgi:hypothetical protein